MKVLRSMLFMLQLHLLLVQSSAGEPSTYTATVRLTLDHEYKETESSLQYLKQVIRFIPIKIISVPKAAKLSTIIFEEYGISQYDAESLSFKPKTYAVIESFILSLNDLRVPEELPPGPLKIPNLPHRAPGIFNPESNTRDKPTATVFDPLQTQIRILGGISVPVTSKTTSFKANRNDSHIEELFIETAPENVELMMKLSPPEEIPKIRTPSFPMSISLNSPMKCKDKFPGDDHKVLTTDDTNLLKATIKAGQRAAPLLILDTGWPNKSSRDSSYQMLNLMMDEVWRVELALERKRKATVDSTFIELENCHADYIRRALTEFESLDNKDLVNVIFVPLTTAQGAKELLIELIETSLLVDDQKLHESDVNYKLPEKAQRKAAESIVNKIPSNWPANNSTVKTDKALLDAILVVAQSYTRNLKTAFFVNTSWTVPHGDYHVYFDEPMGGLLIAAAGNTSSDLQNDFAQRCSQGFDTLAVLNADETGFLCCSSVISNELIDQAFAVSFDGIVHGSTCNVDVCGTSFSAPRIAWLVTLSEVVRPKEKPLNYKAWPGSLRQRLLDLRNQEQEQSKRLLFKINNFFSNP